LAGKSQDFSKSRKSQNGPLLKVLPKVQFLS
jgi:hypothetical protein